MAYIITCCEYEKYKVGEKFKDKQGNKRVCCQLSNDVCIAQRWCPAQKKYVINERAKDICKDYKA